MSIAVKKKPQVRAWGAPVSLVLAASGMTLSGVSASANVPRRASSLRRKGANIPAYSLYCRQKYLRTNPSQNIKQLE
jgi:hypothetical protein